MKNLPPGDDRGGRRLAYAFSPKYSSVGGGRGTDGSGALDPSVEAISVGKGGGGGGTTSSSPKCDPSSASSSSSPK